MLHNLHLLPIYTHYLQNKIPILVNNYILILEIHLYLITDVSFN